MESDLFNAGMRPAVNVGLSVSRVGGAAQSKAMKKASGTIRIDLAQYREIQVFTQFSSDLDNATKEQLKYGDVLMELLKQPLEHPRSMIDQVLLLVLASGKVFLKVENEETKTFAGRILEWFHLNKKALIDQIESTGDLSDDARAEIVAGGEEFVQEYESENKE